MPTLVTTAGSASANSYVTITQFRTYCSGVWPRPAIADLSDDEIERLAVTATRLLDQENWIGVITADTQALAWPRTAARKAKVRVGYWGDYPLTETLSPTYYAIDEIPQPVKDAQCELMLALSVGTYAPAEEDAATINSWQTDGVSVQYATTGGNRKPAGALPGNVRKMLNDLLRGNERIRS